MKNKYFNDASNRLKGDFQLDVIEDILLARQERIVLFADCKNPLDVELEVVTGSLDVIGFEDAKSIKLSTILGAFDYNNSYGYVAGKEAYFQGVYQELHDFKTPKDVSFPILHNGVRKWLRFNIFPSTKQEHISIFTVTDVTILHTQEEETFYKTHTDSLTQLFNKYTFDYHYGLKYYKPGFHVMFMDFDNFKNINDRYGHSIGNVCLVEFGKLLKSLQYNDNHFYRLGGDEFIGLLIGSSEEILALSNKIMDGVRHLKILDTDIRLTISMGVMKATKSEDLARKADSLMYEAKAMGKNHFLYAIESSE
jgi:diguanylate cyclase (GGDEF)-like protein